jgi:hypothetical protein
VLRYNQKETRTHTRKGEKKMFTVWTADEMMNDDVMVFEGTLEECENYVDGDTELYIVEPDGFTVH